MSILVTGGAGFIGSHTVVELLNKNKDVVIADDFSNSHPVVLDRIREITGQDFAFYELNLLEEDALRHVFENEDIETVIHFAAFKAVGESMEKPVKYYHNNLTNTLILLKVMQDFDVKNLIFSSSATVYGEDNPVPFTEDMPVSSATNPYGETKLIIERILQDVYASDPSWSITLLRYFNPIGAHPSGRIGEDPNDIPNNLVPYITQVAIGKLDQLSVYGDDYDTPDGTGIRDYIHVVDLAQGHLKALSKSDLPGVHTYNLGTGVGYSVLDLVHTFEEVNNVPVPYQVVDRRPGDIAEGYADADKAKEDLGWAAQYQLSDMLRDSWNWQKNNPKGYQS